VNAYLLILKRIEDGANYYIIALMSITYYAINAITSAELSQIMTLLNFTFDTSIKALNDGTTDYTVASLFSYCVANLYAASETLNEGIMGLALYNLAKYSYITSDEKATLKAELVAA